MPLDKRPAWSQYLGHNGDEQKPQSDFACGLGSMERRAHHEFEMGIGGGMSNRERGQPSEAQGEKGAAGMTGSCTASPRSSWYTIRLSRWNSGQGRLPSVAKSTHNL